MRHTTHLSKSLPVSAQCPESHTLDFMLGNLPQSILEAIVIVAYHIKNWPQNGEE